jgi:mannose-1-phosphate guanylyltransferase
MCGGNGTRLFPLSTTTTPKQFLKLTHPKLTMFQLTCENALLLNPDKFIIVCNKNHVSLVETQLYELNIKNYTIICEPFGKNTSAAIASASILSHPTDLLLILTADHIWNKNEFVITLNKSKNTINDNSIVFIGIKPTYPETGYGYIKYNKKDVLNFVEKPDFDTAKKYVQDGNYCWNAGVFLFYNTTIINEFNSTVIASKIYNDVKETINHSEMKNNHLYLNEEYFETVFSISIDYSIMEHHNHGKIVCYDDYWSDIGSFESLYNYLPKDENKNVLKGNVKLLNTTDSYIETTNTNKKIVTIGIDNIIIVDTDDSLVIMKKSDSQKIKHLIN